MNTHLAYYKDAKGIYFLSVNGEIKAVEEIDNNCIMNYVTLSRICGTNSIWTIVSLKDIVLQAKDEVKAKMQNKDFQNML